VTQFIEHNWLKDQRLGGGSFDATTGSILDMFDFSQKKTRTVLLDSTEGTVVEASKGKNKHKDKDD
jgi:phospholipase C